MTWEEIERLTGVEIDEAENYLTQTKTPERTVKWDRYYGRNLGNEMKGRSKFISREVMDTVEWILPYLIRTFASGDPKIEIEIEGRPPQIGKALMRHIQDDLGYDDENSLFVCFYQWMKDALVSDTAFTKLFWQRDFEKKKVTFPRLGVAEMVQADNDPNVEIIRADPTLIGNETVFTDVNLRVRSLRKDQLTVENVPHWEFIVSNDARSINDEYGKGHQTKVSVDYLKRINRAYSEEGKSYFENLDALEKGIASRSDYLGDNEEQSYLGTGYQETETEDKTGPKATVTLTEWYTRLDVNGDGYLEDIIIWRANNTLIRWEENEEGFIPFCAISPILDCYKFFGISYADLLIEIQNLKTMLTRRILDNFDFTNLGRWFIKPGANVDIRQLMKNIPGDVIRGDGEGVMNHGPTTSNLGEGLGLLEYVDSTKENRTGITRYNQGVDQTSLNKTATGVSMIQNAAMQRLELIARIFAETGLKDFYRKAVMLYQKYLTRPFIAKVQGRDMQITPEMIQGRVKCKVNMGVEAQVGMVESQKIERMFAFLAQISQLFPGLIGPQQIHNLATRYVTSLGFKQADDFVQELQAFVQHIQQQAQAQQQQAQAQQQAIQQQTQVFQQIESAKVQTNQQKNQIDAKIKSLDIQTDAQIEREKIAQKDRDSQLDFRLGMLKELGNAATRTRTRI